MRRLWSIAPVVVFLSGLPAVAQPSYRNLDAGHPTRVEDAEVTERYALDLDVLNLRYDELSNLRTRLLYEPRLTYGVLPRTEAWIRVPLFYREREVQPRGGIAGIGAGAMYQFTIESEHVPALAMATEVFKPTGPNALPASVSLRADAADIVCVGELRPVKAIDVLIEALALLKRSGRRVSAAIAGEGPEGAALKAQALRLDVADQVRFIGYCPAREAFTMGRMLVIPSRAESLPYIILESAAAAIPLITTNVGGIPEVFGPQAGRLVAPGDSATLAAALGAALADPAPLRNETLTLRARVQAEFSADVMTEGVLAAYTEAIVKFRS